MARLIDLQASAWPPRITLSPGDVLVVGASGGRVPTGSRVVEILGPFLPGVLQANGDILSPMGAPGTVMFRALRPGQAQLSIITGDPWHGAETKTLDVTVAA